MGTVASEWDLAGRRTRLTYPGSGLYLDYDYLVTGEMTKIRENGAPSGAGVLATYGYDDLGRRLSLVRGNGTSATYNYDGASRLQQLAENMPGTSHDLTLGFSYNPAGQIAQSTQSNDLYSLTQHANMNRTDSHNGLNQILASGGAALSHDARGSLTSDGVSTFSYSSENLLTGVIRASQSFTLGYDPLTRLARSSGWGGFQYGYDGLNQIQIASANYGAFRHVFGPGVDEPLVIYSGAGMATRTFLHADERGSIVAQSNEAGTVISTRTYDEYGLSSVTGGAFGYTGQRPAPEAGPDVYHYRSRFYHARLGRFMQTDPIGYGGGMNLYAYVGGDPVNASDPLGRGCLVKDSKSGLVGTCVKPVNPNEETARQDDIVVTAFLIDYSTCNACKSVGLDSWTMITLASGFMAGGAQQGESSGNESKQHRPPCPNVPASRPIGRRDRLDAAMRDPTGAIMARDIAGEAFAAARDRFPGLSGVGDMSDAYRHFYWSYGMTRVLGPDRARAMGNANEVSGNNPLAEQRMDTWNNEAAISMAADPRYRGMPTADVAEIAIRNRCLRTVN